MSTPRKRAAAAPVAPPAAQPPLLHRALATLGGYVCIAALVVGAYFAWRSGILERIENGPEIVTAKLYGPSETLAGGEYFFHIEGSGFKGKAIWKISPNLTGVLTPTEDGTKARFISLEGGDFTIFVAVPGQGLVATDMIEFSNLVENATPPTNPAAPPTGPPPPAAHVPPFQLPPVPTVADLTLQALNDVVSHDRAAEARIIGGSIRSLIGQLQTGQLPPDYNIKSHIAELVQIGLGEKASAWGLFVGEVGAILDALRDQGNVTTAASTVPALQEIATVLTNAK